MPPVADAIPATGYASPDYALSLSEFGVPRLLPRCGGWILEREIPDSPHRDAMGCYPLFACADWSTLRADVDSLSDRYVSLCLVADPFGEYGAGELEQTFDVVLPFKHHFVTDLGRPFPSQVSKNHRRRVRQALRSVEVERAKSPEALLDEWFGFYTHLRARHGIDGISAFSRESFARQLAVPGVVAFRALVEGRPVGIHLWYVRGTVGYYHLGATNDEGYRHGAAYALFWHALESFGRDLRMLDLGGVPGLDDDVSSGLRQFKAGWATETRPAFLCGKILQPDTYRRLAEARGPQSTSYFPAYRASREANGETTAAGAATINVHYCESMLERHGDNYLGVGWTKDARFAALRYQVMLGVLRPSDAPVQLLDFGCGLSHLYEYIRSRNIPNIAYCGLDLSAKMLDQSRRKYPDVTYYQQDILDDRVALPKFDYVIANGIFTYKGSLPQDRMIGYWQALVERLFGMARVGLAFNATSKYVDWERDDLFHLPLETMASFVARRLSRHFTIRHDYGLYEYTVYVYREPEAAP